MGRMAVDILQVIKVGRIGNPPNGRSATPTYDYYVDPAPVTS
jgi:hypothetical protein